MVRLAILVALTLTCGAVLGAEPLAPLVGRAHVIDGDTLDLRAPDQPPSPQPGVATAHAIRIRLNAIDAPEAKQTCRDEERRVFACGAEAAAALRRLVEGQSLRCEPRYLDRYGRTVATCYLGDVDVGQAMVRAGEAIAFRKYGMQYVPDEDETRAARRGLWRGEFTMPAEWRRGER
jgi:endonuclease YncB( thermonuclease family)